VEATSLVGATLLRWAVAIETPLIKAVNAGDWVFIVIESRKKSLEKMRFACERTHAPQAKPSGLFDYLMRKLRIIVEGVGWELGKRATYTQLYKKHVFAGHQRPDELAARAFLAGLLELFFRHHLWI